MVRAAWTATRPISSRPPPGSSQGLGGPFRLAATAAGRKLTAIMVTDRSLNLSANRRYVRSGRQLDRDVGRAVLIVRLGLPAWLGRSLASTGKLAQAAGCGLCRVLRVSAPGLVCACRGWLSAAVADPVQMACSLGGGRYAAGVRPDGVKHARAQRYWHPFSCDAVGGRLRGSGGHVAGDRSASGSLGAVPASAAAAGTVVPARSFGRRLPARYSARRTSAGRSRAVARPGQNATALAMRITAGVMSSSGGAGVMAPGGVPRP